MAETPEFRLRSRVSKASKSNHIRVIWVLTATWVVGPTPVGRKASFLSSGAGQMDRTPSSMRDHEAIDGAHCGAGWMALRVRELNASLPLLRGRTVDPGSGVPSGAQLPGLRIMTLAVSDDAVRRLRPFASPHLLPAHHSARI